MATQSRDADHVVAYETVTDLRGDTWLADYDMFQLQPFTCLWMGEFERVLLYRKSYAWMRKRAKQPAKASFLWHASALGIHAGRSPTCSTA
jgi:hypothetical protein